MTDETWMLVAEHVQKLVEIATNCPDTARRNDAVKSLAVMALLVNNVPRGGGGEPLPVVEAEIVDLRSYQKVAA